VERECGTRPSLVATSARPVEGVQRTSFSDLRDMLEKSSNSFLLLLGTGWGLAESVLSQSDYILQAVQGSADYNHLSVRSATAIMLHELLAPIRDD